MNPGKVINAYRSDQNLRLGTSYNPPLLKTHFQYPEDQEPSCASVFRDEMTNLLPHDEDARRLRQQTFLLSEFLTKKAPHYRLPTLKNRAVVHGHCHHKALMKMKDEEAVLQQLGLDFEVLDSGCCGMAGSFGFESSHYDISTKCGERVLLPAVREAGKDTLIIANGFSCREQIAQATERQALHLAQVIQIAMHHEGKTEQPYPEQGHITSPAVLLGSTQSKVLTGLGLLLATGALVWGIKRR